ncbi:MAG: ferritin-like domain-containing protein [Phycisphaeraceae bacterium]
MATLRNLEDAFVEELKDIFHAEKQLLKAMPKMARAAHDPQLKELLQEHLDETQQQVKRLEAVFHSLDRTARGRKCEGMLGLVEEGQEMMQEKGSPDVNDAIIIASAQKIEHYEIASYGTICKWADMLGFREQGDLLKQNLAEEKAADEKLTELAEIINRHAQPA